MKVLFCSDLHGEVHLYGELLELSDSTEADWILLGGDLLPSSISEGGYEELLRRQKRFVEDFLLPLFRKMLQGKKRRIGLIPGNWDLGYSYLFREAMEKVVDLNQRLYRSERGYEILGYGFVPPTPFRPKEFEKMDDLDSPWPPQKNPSYIKGEEETEGLIPVDPFSFLRERGTIAEDLAALPLPLRPERTIFLMHAPPFNTGLDVIAGNQHVGSRSIRSFIERTQPRVSLHGHIHEAPQLSGQYLDRIGKTPCLNPGQFTRKIRGVPKLHAVTFELEDLEGSLLHTCL
jgi:Icc-related predicted phosphoesterase